MRQLATHVIRVHARAITQLKHWKVDLPHLDSSRLDVGNTTIVRYGSVSSVTPAVAPSITDPQ